MDSFFFTLFLIHYKILVEVIVILLIIYPKCSTCIKAKKYLEDKSISFDIRDIVLDKLNVDELKKYINLSKLDINRFFNTSGMKYRELGNSGIKVSVVGHGTWALGGDFFGEVDDGLIHIGGLAISPELVAEAIRSLPEEKQKAVLMYYFEDMSDMEIARVLNIPRSTVQYRRKSSFRPLKKYLEENADEDD